MARLRKKKVMVRWRKLEVTNDDQFVILTNWDEVCVLGARRLG